MQYAEYIIIALFLFLIFKRFLPAKSVSNISTAELKTQLNDKNKQFLDVRTSGEFNGNHIKEFKNIPLHQLAPKSRERTCKGKRGNCYLSKWNEEPKASKILKNLGFSNVTNVKGGMNAWI